MPKCSPTLNNNKSDGEFEKKNRFIIRKLNYKIIQGSGKKLKKNISYDDVNIITKLKSLEKIMFVSIISVKLIGRFLFERLFIEDK